MITLQEAFDDFKSVGFIKDDAGLQVLSGGTDGQAGAVVINGTKTLVIKTNNPFVIKADTVYFEIYKDLPLVTKLRYKDPENRYHVCDFVVGDMPFGFIPSKEGEILKQLNDDLLWEFQVYSGDVEGWGQLYDPVGSWHEFMQEEMKRTKERIEGVLSADDQRLVNDLIDQFYNANPVEKYLIHGDCGTHNFIYKEDKLISVIDPSPILGEPLYDLLYAFCSKPLTLKADFFHEVCKISDNKLIAGKLLPVLCYRIGTATKYHPHDIPAYLEEWGYWKSLL